MPTIELINSIKINMYFFDHYPAHFHAIYAEHEELIAIETLETLQGAIPTRQRKLVIKWATENQDFLREQWKLHNPS